MLMVGAILLAIGSVLNFHKMRQERDAALADVSVRFDGMRYRFVLDGIDGMATRGLRPGSVRNSRRVTSMSILMEEVILLIQTLCPQGRHLQRHTGLGLHAHVLRLDR
jgi:hypothetical protein